MFNKISYYFFKKLLVAFTIGILILSLSLFLMQIARFVETITSKGLPISLLFYLSGLTMQNLWVELVPFVLALSIIFTWFSMRNSNELTAIISFGVSYAKLSILPLLFAFFLIITSFMVSNFFLPTSYLNYQKIKQNIENSYNLKSLEVEKFNQLSDTFSFYVKSIEGDFLKEIIIKMNSGSSSIILFAESGRVDIKNQSIVLVLQNVTLQEFNDTYNATSFAQLSTYYVDLSESAKIAITKNRPREFSITELLNTNSSDYVKSLVNNPKQFSTFKSQLSKELISRVVSLILPFLFILVTIYYLTAHPFTRQGNVIVYVKIILILLLIKTYLIVATNTFNNIYILLTLLILIPIIMSLLYLFKIIMPTVKLVKL